MKTKKIIITKTRIWMKKKVNKDNNNDEIKMNINVGDELVKWFEPFKTSKNLKHVDPAKLPSEYNAKKITSDMLDVCSQMLSRISIKDLRQANHFFKVLFSIENKDFDKNFEKFKAKEQFTNDIYAFGKEINFNLTNDILRALCAIALLTPSNKEYQSYLSSFGDDTKKQLINDPVSILTEINKTVIKNLEYEHSVWLEKKKMKELTEIHTNPVLPDDIDELGNLPYLKCGWKRCGQVFLNRDHLLEHVKRCIAADHALLHRFHVHCRSVLEANPDLSVNEFSAKVKPLFKEKTALVTDKCLEAYHKQFQPFFKKLNQN